MICTACNWTRHDPAECGVLTCRNGHRQTPENQYGDGRCRECRRDYVRRYDRTHRKEARARYRAWRQRKMAEPAGSRDPSTSPRQRDS